jgi:hypothetical protein
MEIMKIYHAIVWFNDRPDQPGLRVTLVAENLDAAAEKLEAEYGRDCIYTLKNEEEAARPRSKSCMKIYNAIIWFNDRPEQPGLRVPFIAENLTEAIEKLKAEYGNDCTYFLTNKEEGEKLRDRRV